tara:strand:+ start:2346 stop:2528 length:183 start_codon:yes stop_codon:yes gene_type:complete
VIAGVVGSLGPGGVGPIGAVSVNLGSECQKNIFKTFFRMLITHTVLDIWAIPVPIIFRGI